MTRDRAIAVLRWGCYTKPAPRPHEFATAHEMLRNDPTLRPALSWPQPPTPKEKR